MVECLPEVGSFRGSPSQIRRVRTLLEAGDPARAHEALAPLGLRLAEDPILDGIAAALHSPLFHVDLLNAGPAALHEHTITVGAQGAAVRVSPLSDAQVELAVASIQSLPGGLARLVRFLACTPPPDSAPVAVTGSDLTDLTSPSADIRTQAFGRVSALLDATQPEPQDDSWQLVVSTCTWTYPDGQAGRDTGSYLRRGDQCFLILESGDGAVLAPVRSARAWETLIQVLPSQHEVAVPH